VASGEYVSRVSEVIYLDHNATTPVLPEAVEAMMPWLTTQWGNPSSAHRAGKAARRAVEEAREKVAEWLEAESNQIIFTSGATEANNAAIHSALIRQPGKRHIVTSAVEHSAVLAYCYYVETHHGVEITRLSVDPDGLLSPPELESAIRPDTALVSLMWANNETGVIWPVDEFAEVCRRHGVLFHTDAVQSVGKIPVSFAACGADFLTLSGHKFGGPKGVGALIVVSPDQYHPLIFGGKQESGYRGGTENVTGIVALGAAAEQQRLAGLDRWDGVKKIRDQLERAILDVVPHMRVHGSTSPRLPNTSNLWLPEIDADAIVTFLSQRGICVSSGSACLESAISPSHVILAMSGSHEVATESIRISFGLESTMAELEELMKSIDQFAVLTA
jgi:cysteine desulfurase